MLTGGPCLDLLVGNGETGSAQSGSLLGLVNCISCVGATDCFCYSVTGIHHNTLCFFSLSLIFSSLLFFLQNILIKGSGI